MGKQHSLGAECRTGQGTFEIMVRIRVSVRLELGLYMRFWLWLWLELIITTQNRILNHDPFVRKERAHKEIKFRNYRQFSPEEFRKELLENDSITNTDWPEHILSEKWDKFKNAFLRVSNKCAPLKHVDLKIETIRGSTITL